MSRQKLIKQLKQKFPKLNNSEIDTIINIFSNSIKNALQHENSIQIREIGRWYCKKLKENSNARNPSTNELIYKPERVKVRFKAFKKLNWKPKISLVELIREMIQEDLNEARKEYLLKSKGFSIYEPKE